LGTEDCIRLIQPESVFEAVKRLLDRQPGISAGSGFCSPEFVLL
jgi:hypothetical protein